MFVRAFQLHLLQAANAGNVTYRWSTGVDLDSISVSPQQATSYSITATSTNNCTATSTVTVNIAPASLDIGASDTAVCLGDSVLVCVSNGFTTYNWNNGSVGQCIEVHTSGIYSRQPVAMLRAAQPSRSCNPSIRRMPPRW